MMGLLVQEGVILVLDWSADDGNIGVQIPSPVNTDLLECACAVTTCIQVHPGPFSECEGAVNQFSIRTPVCLSVYRYADSKVEDLMVPDSIPGTYRFFCESLRLEQGQLGFRYKLKSTVAKFIHLRTNQRLTFRVSATPRATTPVFSPALGEPLRQQIFQQVPRKLLSVACEVRPGPEFVLRSYTFMKNNSFKLLQFHYEDEWCSLPLYTITARGRVWLRENSWVTRGATEAEYTLERATVTAHSAGVAAELARRVNTTCPGQVRRRWKPYRYSTLLTHSREYVVYSLPGEDEDDNTISNQHPPVVIPHPRRENTLTGRLRLMHTEDVDCLSALHAVFHELQLVRVHRRPPGPPDSRYPRHELLLGDLHSRPELRSQYRPTAFQTPLLRADQVRKTAAQSRLGKRYFCPEQTRTDQVRETTAQSRLGERLLLRADQVIETAAQSRPGDRDCRSEQTRRCELLGSSVLTLYFHTLRATGLFCGDPPFIFTRCELLGSSSQWCPVCQAVSRGSERAPPDLHARPRLPVLHSYLAGEWVSTRCETRPLGLFLKRRLRFSAVDRTWRGEYRFFGDLACTAPLFTATAGGRYSGRGSELDFRMEQASLTVLDSAMAKSLRCGAEPWVSGVPRDLSRSHGCSDLGILVPSVEYETVRVDVDSLGSSLLLLGQPDTDNRRRGPEDRPTAYQPPLVQCRPQDDDHDNALYPVHYAQVGPRSYASGAAPSSCVVLFLNLGIALVGAAQRLLNM
uniref:APCDD1 domain-containing protein n=1 Tax=Timema tahoe TaxID=61484 RepID=A0A7R9P0A6_9NEOP|nr:unnamed protein product [Timema tahoe]